MKKLLTGLTALAAMLMSSIPAHAAVGVQGERFTKIYYFYGASGKGSATGLDAGNAKAIATANFMLIPANTVIENVYMIMDSAVNAGTICDVGDTDQANGYLSYPAVNWLAAGIWGYDAYAKALSNSTGSATSNYLAYSTNSSVLGKSTISSLGKLYVSASKYVKLTCNTTASAGQFRVVVQGFRLR